MKGEKNMNIYGVERIWLYLHDDKRVVSPNAYVTNRYSYLRKLIEMLTLNPEYINELRFRMYTERICDSDYFLSLRDGYGKTEYRLVKLMKVKNLGSSLAKIFPELVPKNEKKTLNLLP